MTEEEKQVVKNLLELTDYWIEKGKPVSKCPDQVQGWRGRGYNNRKYKAAIKLINGD